MTNIKPQSSAARSLSRSPHTMTSSSERARCGTKPGAARAAAPSNAKRTSAGVAPRRRARRRPGNGSARHRAPLEADIATYERLLGIDSTSRRRLGRPRRAGGMRQEDNVKSLEARLTTLQDMWFLVKREDHGDPAPVAPSSAGTFPSLDLARMRELAADGATDAFWSAADPSVHDLELAEFQAKARGDDGDVCPVAPEADEEGGPARSRGLAPASPLSHDEELELAGLQEILDDGAEQSDGFVLVSPETSYDAEELDFAAIQKEAGDGDRHLVWLDVFAASSSDSHVMRGWDFAGLPELAGNEDYDMDWPISLDDIDLE